MEISQNFAAFSENMNFTIHDATYWCFHSYIPTITVNARLEEEVREDHVPAGKPCMPTILLSLCIMIMGFLSFFLFLSSLVLVYVVSSPYRRQAAPLAIMTPIFKTLVFPQPMGRQIVLPTPFKNVAMVRWYIIIYIKVKNGITIYFQYALLPFQIFAGWGMMNGLDKYPNRFCCRYLLYLLQLNPTLMMLWMTEYTVRAPL